MKSTKSIMAFNIGSSLDNDKAWSSDTKKKIKNILKEKKEPYEHSLVLKKEKQRGKIVSLVGEFFVSDIELKDLSKTIKKKLGSGGSCKNGWMEFQGDCCEKLKPLIKDLGFRFKNG